jgi:hypothetical protein
MNGVIMEGLALAVLIMFSLVGFMAIFFTTFGTLIILIGSLSYAVMTEFSIINIKILIILLILYLCGELLEYISIIIGAKKFGASNRAIIGAIIGGIIGAVAGVGFLGIGLLLGTFLGIFLGAFLVELCIQRDFVKSLKSGTGSVIGRVGSIIAKVVIAIVMLVIVAIHIINP